MDTIEKRIQAYLSKIPKQKVELSIIDDIDKLFDRGLSENKRVRTQLEKLAREYNETSRFFSDMLTKIRRAEDLAKELGDKETLKSINNLKSEANYYLDEITSRSQKILSILP